MEEPDIISDEIKRLEERKDHLEKVKMGYLKAQLVLPFVQQNIDITDWQIRVYKSLPPESIEIPRVFDKNKLDIENHYLQGLYKIPDIPSDMDLYSGTAITLSGSSDDYSNNNPINYNDPTGHWGINVGFNISGFLNNFWNGAGQVAGISNLSSKLVNILDTASLACDSFALVADSIVVAGDAAGAIIGGTGGAVAGGLLAGPEASPITGGPGAALGALIVDAALKPLTIVGNGLATLSTACTIESDFFTGDNNYSGTLSIGSKGMGFMRN